MPGVVLNEQVDRDNPLLQFYFQQGGLMQDVEYLHFSVWDLSANAEKVPDTAVDLTEYDLGGDRLGTGQYAATFLPDATWAAGTHEVRWEYKVTLAGLTKKWRQRFEVLNEGLVTSGTAYVGYADTSEMLKSNVFTCYSVDQLHETLMETGQLVQDLTGRFFGPKFMQQRHNATSAGALPIDDPIIGIRRIVILGAEMSDELTDVDLSFMRIYNRHLEGLISPDDRDNPRIEFSSDLIPGKLLLQGMFYEGRLNTLIDGVFGYTEPDGGPIGTIPRALKRAVGILSLRRLQDPFGLDVFTSNPGRILEARTRDQQVKFAGADGGGVGPLTGDRIVDDILMQYMRPPYYGAVAEAGASRNRTYPERVE
jgi:hypothetical protein